MLRLCYICADFIVLVLNVKFYFIILFLIYQKPELRGMMYSGVATLSGALDRQKTGDPYYPGGGE